LGFKKLSELNYAIVKIETRDIFTRQIRLSHNKAAVTVRATATFEKED